MKEVSDQQIEAEAEKRFPYSPLVETSDSLINFCAHQQRNRSLFIRGAKWARDSMPDPVLNWTHVNEGLPPKHKFQHNHSIQVLITDGKALNIFKELVVEVSRYNFFTLTWMTLRPMEVVYWCPIPDHSNLPPIKVDDIRRSNSDEPVSKYAKRLAKLARRDARRSQQLTQKEEPKKPEPFFKLTKIRPSNWLHQDKGIAWEDLPEGNFHEPE